MECAVYAALNLALTAIGKPVNRIAPVNPLQPAVAARVQINPLQTAHAAEPIAAPIALPVPTAFAVAPHIFPLVTDTVASGTGAFVDPNANVDLSSVDYAAILRDPANSDLLAGLNSLLSTHGGDTEIARALAGVASQQIAQHPSTAVNIGGDERAEPVQSVQAEADPPLADTAFSGSHEQAQTAADMMEDGDPDMQDESTRNAMMEELLRKFGSLDDLEQIINAQAHQEPAQPMDQEHPDVHPAAMDDSDPPQ